MSEELKGTNVSVLIIGIFIHWTLEFSAPVCHTLFCPFAEHFDPRGVGCGVRTEYLRNKLRFLLKELVFGARALGRALRSEEESKRKAGLTQQIGNNGKQER
jgi:hypothetical protein